MTPQRQKIPMIIENSTDLDRLAERLAGEKVIAFDLEADSLHHYREKVCLIQVATEKAVFLVDPLAVTDISPLGPLLANPDIRKVFHGADYDIRSLYRDFSLEVRNLFDTMIACQLLGEKEVGLAAALKKRFGVELDKRYQKADWSKRPLDSGMIAYAAADTSLLVALYRQLEAELVARGRLSWVEEESAFLSEVRAADREGEPLFCRFKGASKMEPRTLAVLEELLRFRDMRACSTDRPPFKVLSNETLRALAEKKPRKVQELNGIPGLPPTIRGKVWQGNPERSCGWMCASGGTAAPVSTCGTTRTGCPQRGEAQEVEAVAGGKVPGTGDRCRIPCQQCTAGSFGQGSATGRRRA